MDTPYTRTLRRALATLGEDESRLAESIGVSRQMLAAWLSGQSKPPVEIYIRALEIFANGPLWLHGEAGTASGDADLPRASDRADGADSAA